MVHKLQHARPVLGVARRAAPKPGKYVAADGAVLEGEFKDGKLHGHGKDVVATGDVYEGQWKEGKRHGKGRYVSADGGNDGDRPATAGLGARRGGASATPPTAGASPNPFS